MQKDRPRIKIPHSKHDYICIYITTGFIICNIALILMNYSTLPDQVPIHFNFKGEADNYSGKGSIIALPIISFLSSALLIYLTKFPHNYNYPIKITKENALREYTYSKQMILQLAVVIAGVFLFVTNMILSKANGFPNPLGQWSTAIIVLATLAPIFIYMLRRSK